MVHLLAFELNFRTWFEFVPSEQNWADGISRDGFRDTVVQNYGFSTVNVQSHPQLWHNSLQEAWEDMKGIVRCAPQREHWI